MRWARSGRAGPSSSRFEAPEFILPKRRERAIHAFFFFCGLIGGLIEEEHRNYWGGVPSSGLVHELFKAKTKRPHSGISSSIGKVLVLGRVDGRVLQFGALVKRRYCTTRT